MNNDNSKQYYDAPVELRQIIKSLIARSRFIFGFTGVVTLIVIGYALSLTAPPPQYKVEVLFEKPDENSVIKLNHNFDLGKTSDSIFTIFLTNLNSKLLQKETFIDGGYAKKLAEDGMPMVNIDSDIDQFIKKILINTSKKELGADAKYPKILSISGSNPDTLSEYLDEVLAKADKKTVNYFINIQKLKILNRLNEITIERQLLLTKTKQDRLSQIKRIKVKDNQLIREINNSIDTARLKAKQERLSQIKRIKEEDNQKIREINNSIDRARIKAKTERLNQIVILTNAAKLASSLGITNNNLKNISDKTSVEIRINDNDQIPDWYLYGEVALLEMIQLLQKRTNDDPYIADLAILTDRINEIENNSLLKTLEDRMDDDPYIKDIAIFNGRLIEIKNNNLLQTLEERLDDSPFVIQINQLDVETIKLESISLNSTGINSMQLYQPATSNIIPSNMTNKKLLILKGLIGGFILSLIFAFLMILFKEDHYSIQKGK